MERIIITADDFGYAPSYDRGIAEAAAAGAIDAVSAMVGEGRDSDPALLADTVVEVGLHLELKTRWPAEREERRAAIAAELEHQWERFRERFGAEPTHIDGHRHCHAAAQTSVPVARFARDRRVPLRAVSPRHGRLVRCIGASTPDRTVGRLQESEPAMPDEVAALLAGEPVPDGITEWIVHPGHRDPAAGSSYDAGRAEDLELVLELASRERLRQRRTSHAAALAGASSGAR